MTLEEVYEWLSATQIKEIIINLLEDYKYPSDVLYYWYFDCEMIVCEPYYAAIIDDEEDTMIDSFTFEEEDISLFEELVNAKRTRQSNIDYILSLGAF